MRRPLLLVSLVAAVAAAAVAGCSSGSAGRPASSPSSPSSTPTAGSPTPHPVVTQPVPQGITKVLTVVEENHGLAAARTGMPYLASLADQYGVATDYRALAHPSLPNYLAMTSGSTLGVRDDAGPSAHPVSGPSVFDLALS